MPTFEATDSQTGKTIEFEWSGEGEPTEADIAGMFQEDSGSDDWKKAGEAIRAALNGGGKEQMSARDMAAMGMGGAASNPMVQHAHDNPGQAVADTAGIAAGPLAGPAGALIRAGAAKALPLVGKAIPAVGGAASGVMEGYTMGGPAGAVVGGVVGAVTKKGPTALLAGGMQKAAQAAQAARGATAAAPAVAEAASAAPAAAKVVAEAGGHTKDVAALFKMAKEAGKEFKKGEKVWILLKDGKAAKILTPDQAGAAKRAGEMTTWVKNLWS